MWFSCSVLIGNGDRFVLSHRRVFLPEAGALEVVPPPFFVRRACTLTERLCTHGMHAVNVGVVQMDGQHGAGGISTARLRQSSMDCLHTLESIMLLPLQ